MKYVVFALLFSVTTTLSLPGQPSGNATVSHSNSSTVKGTVVNNVTEVIPVTDITETPETTTTIVTTTTSNSTSTSKPNTTTVTPPPSSTPDPKTTTLKPTPTPTPPTTPKPAPSPTTPTTTKPDPTPTTTKATSSIPPHSSVKPIDPTTTAPTHHDRKFDGPSFVGGIVLALGLVAIGFVAFKFYKARTESNYHTL